MEDVVVAGGAAVLPGGTAVLPGAAVLPGGTAVLVVLALAAHLNTKHDVDMNCSAMSHAL